MCGLVRSAAPVAPVLWRLCACVACDTFVAPVSPVLWHLPPVRRVGPVWLVATVLYGLSGLWRVWHLCGACATYGACAACGTFMAPVVSVLWRLSRLCSLWCGICGVCGACVGLNEEHATVFHERSGQTGGAMGLCG